MKRGFVLINSKTTHLFLVLVGILFSCQSDKLKSGLNSVESKMDTLNFFDSKTKLYVLAKTWGLVGNHEELRIFSDKSADTIRLHTSEAYYKVVGNDSLIIYAPGSTITKQTKTNVDGIKIRLVELETCDDVIDYDRNYHKYGLKKISALKN